MKPDIFTMTKAELRALKDECESQGDWAAVEEIDTELEGRSHETGNPADARHRCEGTCPECSIEGHDQCPLKDDCTCCADTRLQMEENNA